VLHRAFTLAVAPVHRIAVVTVATDSVMCVTPSI